jgi:hypothetical protein
MELTTRVVFVLIMPDKIHHLSLIDIKGTLSRWAIRVFDAEELLETWHLPAGGQQDPCNMCQELLVLLQVLIDPFPVPSALVDEPVLVALSGGSHSGQLEVLVPEAIAGSADKGVAGPTVGEGVLDRVQWDWRAEAEQQSITERGSFSDEVLW